MEQLSVFGRNVSEFLSPDRIELLIRVAILIFVGVPVSFIFSRWTHRNTAKKYPAQMGMLAGKVVLYLGLGFIVFSILRELGFKVSHLIGAAGIVGIAIGFASQTSISNIISGWFLIAEQPFAVNDLIVVGGTTGTVLSIDLLSIKLRTPDNQFIRIPNETIIKSEVRNITRFPIRRLDLNIGVAYKEDIGRVRKVLMDLAHENPLCLQDPEPVIIFSGFGDSSVNLVFAVWVLKSDYLKLKNSIQEAIKEQFDEKGIEFPFPHRAIYAGSVTRPLPIQIVDPSGGRTQ